MLLSGCRGFVKALNAASFGKKGEEKEVSSVFQVPTIHHRVHYPEWLTSST